MNSRPWDTMNPLQRATALLVWNPTRVHRMPSFIKIDEDNPPPDAHVICPCEFRRHGVDHDGKIPDVMPPLASVKLYRFDHYSLSLSAYAGQCQQCKKYLFAAETLEEQSKRKMEKYL